MHTFKRSWAPGDPRCNAVVLLHCRGFRVSYCNVVWCVCASSGSRCDLESASQRRAWKVDRSRFRMRTNSPATLISKSASPGLLPHALSRSSIAAQSAQKACRENARALKGPASAKRSTHELVKTSGLRGKIQNVHKLEAAINKSCLHDHICMRASAGKFEKEANCSAMFRPIASTS